MFNSKKGSPYTKFPKYLYDDNTLNDFKYLIGFETWTKFIPFTIFYNTSKSIDIPVLNRVTNIFANTTDLDLIGDWSHGTAFGEEIVKNKYLNNLESVSHQTLRDMLNRMKTRFENELYPVIQKNQNKQFMFILPPYSALYWYDTELKGYANILYDFKKYMIIELSQLSNVVVHDFQNYEGIVDLNNYKDTTHYVPEFNDMMIESLAESKFVIDEDNVDQNIESLKERVTEFKSSNTTWLK